MNEEHILSLDNLNVFYKDFHAVNNITMDIARNHVTAFIGPSGCGKSTVLRSINKMVDLVPGASITGKILFEGEDVNAPDMNVTVIRKRIGMVFQKPNPFPKSIFDNVAWGARTNGYQGDIHMLVEDSLKKAALWEEVKDKLKQNANQLSGGQQQRLCIARTLAVQPDLILMDEPTSALDPIATGKIEDLILELKEKYTIVIVTHNIGQAGRVSDTTAFFLVDEKRQGYLVEMNPTEKMFMQPDKKETEDYISGKFG